MNYWKPSTKRPKPFTAICIDVKAHDYLAEDGETTMHQKAAIYCDMYFVPARKNYDDTPIPEAAENDEGYFSIEWQYIKHWCYMKDVKKILKRSLKNA